MDRRAVRVLAAILVLCGGLGLYKLAQLVATPRFSFTTPLDLALPFLPWTLPVYLAFFPMILAGALFTDRREFAVLQVATLACLFIALACFLVVPATMTRPDPALIENPFLRRRFTRMWGVDDPHNTFPSLHVAATWCVAWALAKRRRGGLAVAAAIAISASTLTVKQHTLADVAGGFALSLAATRWARWRATRWPSPTPPGPGR